MPKVYIRQANGRVALRKVSCKTLNKKYMKAEEVTGKQYYVYRKAFFLYDPITNEFYWVNAKRSNRRSHHRATIYVRMKAPPKKREKPVIEIPAVGERAIEIRFDTYYAEAHAEQPSPFPVLHKSFWVPKSAIDWTYTYYDFGNYPERWRVGLLSDILHRIMFNAGKSMYDGRWKLWRIPEYENKVDVRLPGRKNDKEPVYRDFELLIEAINKAFEEAMEE